MQKDNVRVKSDITIVDEITAIESMVSYYFTDNEYTPYYADMAKVTVIAENFLDGVEFESEDYVYQLVMENDDIYECVKKFLEIPTSQDKESVDCYVRMEKIMKQVDDVVEFKKQKLIHNSDAFYIVGDMCAAIKTIIDDYAKNNEIAQKFISDLQESGITEETLTNAVRNASNQFKMPESEIIEGQRKRIAEQQERLQEKETEIQDLRKWKREHMARNVKAVQGTGVISGKGAKSATKKTSKTSKKIAVKADTVADVSVEKAMK